MHVLASNIHIQACTTNMYMYMYAVVAEQKRFNYLLRSSVCKSRLMEQTHLRTYSACARVTVIVCPHIITVPVCPRPLTGCRCRRTTCWWSSACTRQCSGQNRLSLSGWRLRTAHTLSLNKARRDIHTHHHPLPMCHTLYITIWTQTVNNHMRCVKRH